MTLRESLFDDRCPDGSWSKHRSRHCKLGMGHTGPRNNEIRDMDAVKTAALGNTSVPEPASPGWAFGVGNEPEPRAAEWTSTRVLQAPYQTVDLPAGSLIVERYVYESTRTGKPGIQWLAEVVDKDGNLLLLQACKTRREALAVVSGV